MVDRKYIDKDGMWTVTYGKLLEIVAQKQPDHLAIKYTDRDYERTYAELNAEAETIAKGFMGMGVKKGDHIAIWATNIPEWFLTLFAAAKLGAVLVTVNTAYKRFELEYLLRQSDTKVLVMDQKFKSNDYMEIVNELCPMLKDCEPGKLDNPMLPYLKSIVYCGPERHAGTYQFGDLYELAKDIDDAEFRQIYESTDCQEVFNMQYTSGTTGFPKGVMLTHYNVVNNGRDIGECMKFTPDDKLCIVVPLFHCFGLVLATTASLTHGSAMVPVDLFHPLKCMDAIQNERCTAFHGVPTMYIAMLEHETFKDHDFSSMRTGIMAGSPCPIKVMQQVVEQMNMREITITYGQTEASPATTMTNTGDSLEKRVATVGRSMPHVETKIIDPETGKTLGPNQPGEFCSRGYNTMKGYYKMEEATRAVIDEDGWLHSGDIAMVDEDGYYKITGRIKDMIIRGGENIYPKEIEEFLYTIPQIKDVQVIGVPSERYGEEVMACIVLKEGESMTEQEVKDAVRAGMARHKVPSYVWFMDDFPMTASGKIQKFKLREQAVEHLNLGAAAAIETE